MVTHESIRHWCRKFGADFARRLRRRRPSPGDTWYLDEVFIRIPGVLHQLWRAVDQHGVILDILVQDRRNGGLPSGSPSPLAPPVSDPAARSAAALLRPAVQQRMNEL